MVRRSSTSFLFILFLVLVPGQLLSLGLGDIEVNSALNQPLNAQINLIAARDDEFEEMRVELAPANVFDRVGVPRPFFLTQLKFQPIKLPGGGAAVRVTSKDPVREPFLTFLVEVTWPKGRLLREYTVLLDPPEFAQQQAPQIATPVTAPIEEVPVEEPPVVEASEPIDPSVIEAQTVNEPEVMAAKPEVVSPEEELEKIRAEMDRKLGIDHSIPVEKTAQEEIAQVESIEPEQTVEEIEEEVVETVAEMQTDATETLDTDVIVPEDIPATEETVTEEVAPQADASEETSVEIAEVEGIADSEVLVRGGDTLSEIAQSRRQGQATVNQMMLAIQQANPNAFIEGNVNLLKKGAVLRIPSVDEANATSSTEARKEIAQQNALWREYRGKLAQSPAANVDAPSLVKEEQNQIDKAKVAEQTLKDAAKPSESSQELNILAGDASNQTSGAQAASSEEIKKLQKEINLAKEQALSKSKEAEELQSRVQELESMLEKKDKILNIQSQQLKDLQDQLTTETEKIAAVEKTLKEKAELEAELKAQQAAKQAAEEAKLKAEEEAKKAEELAQLKAKEEAEKAAKEAEAAKQAAEKVVAQVEKPNVEPLPDFKDDPASAEQSISTPRLEPLPDWDKLPDIEAVPEQTASAEPQVEPVEEKPAEPKPEVSSEQPADVASTDSGANWLTNILGFLDSFKTQLQIGTGVLAVLLGGIWFWKRRQVKTVELSGLGDMPMDAIEDSDHFDDILDETIITPQKNTEADVSEEDVQAFEEINDIASDSSSEVASDSSDAGAGEDVLDEADVYISYGLHQQAQDLLNDAIAKEPGRNDYKAKLAEVYYSQKDQSGFEEYAGNIKDDLGESSSEWQKIMSMGKELAPASALFAGAAAVGVATQSDKPEEADIDIGIQTPMDEAISDDNLEDTVQHNDIEEDDGGLDFNIDDEVEDDPVASKIMQANETSDILNFDVDDLADDILEDSDEVESDVDNEIDAIATGLHETASMDDLTEELENIGMQTTMNDLQPLDIEEDEFDDLDLANSTIAMSQDELAKDTSVLEEGDPDATVAYTSNSISESDQDATAAFTSSSIDDALSETEQFDPSSMDTEFLDPAEQTVAQTHTDLEELGPPSLIEEVGTKLDLAKAFVDMGDSDAAKETLLEVINEGDESQIKAAKDLMDKLGS